MFGPINFTEGYIEGPEYEGNAFYIAFSPITIDPLAGMFLYICACEIGSEHEVSRAPGGDADDGRLAFRVYRTNAAKK